MDASFVIGLSAAQCLAERDEMIGTGQVPDGPRTAGVIGIERGIGGIGEGSDDDGLGCSRRGKTA